MRTRSLAHLTDVALVAEVERLARCERDATVVLVAHLAEMSSRRWLFLGAGFPSLFEYCRKMLLLSEGEAYNRVVAARVVRRYPWVLDRLASGSLNLTTLRLLAKHLNPENVRELVEAADGKSKREVERLVVTRFPQPAQPDSIRKVAAGPSHIPADPEGVLQSGFPQAPPPDRPAAAMVERGSEAPPPVSPPAARPASINPISESQYTVRFTASSSTRDKLEAAQAILRHAIPTGDVAEILDRALQLLLEDAARTKFAATDRPRQGKETQPGSRHIPAAVRRAVWVRDCVRCAYVSPMGRRCAERGFLEFHHVRPYAAGGEATVENIELRCRAHNAYEADVFFGPMRVSEAAPTWGLSAVQSHPVPERDVSGTLSNSDARCAARGKPLGYRGSASFHGTGSRSGQPPAARCSRGASQVASSPPTVG